MRRNSFSDVERSLSQLSVVAFLGGLHIVISSGARNRVPSVPLRFEDICFSLGPKGQCKVFPFLQRVVVTMGLE